MSVVDNVTRHWINWHWINYISISMNKHHHKNSVMEWLRKIMMSYGHVVSIFLVSAVLP